MASTFNNILNGIVPVLAAVVPSGVTVVRRKKIRKRKGDVLPLVLVTGLRSVPEDYNSEGYVYKRYEVQIACLYAGNQILQSGFSLSDTLELVEKTLNIQSLDGVTSIYDTDVVENPAYDSNQLDEDVEEGVLQINYFTFESKN